jgi:hypothetical protein
MLNLFIVMQNWQSRGPKVIAKELKQIQKESFKVQQELLQFIEDATNIKNS